LWRHRLDTNALSRYPQMWKIVISHL
jgi:hypothetical protein